MSTEKLIKVIKQAERNNSQALVVDKRRTSVGNDLEETKRNAVAIVTGWVRELRRKKAHEAAHGFQSLFERAS